MSIASSTELLLERLKESGLRVTPQRLAVYRALANSTAHPTAQTLFEQLRPTMPSLSQSTVYNTLQAFVTHGLIQEIGEAGDGALHYDADIRPHINLICTTCHCVEDFVDVPLHDVSEQVMARSGFQVQGMRVAYYGVCAECQTETIEQVYQP